MTNRFDLDLSYQIHLKNIETSIKVFNWLNVTKLTITTIIVIIIVDNIVVNVGSGQQQVEFLFKRKHFAIDLRAVRLQTFCQIILLILK